MALYGDGTNMTGAVFDGTTLNVIQCDGTWVWARPFSLSSSAGTGTTVTITRSSSPYANASTGTIGAGTTIYYGDVLKVKYSLSSGYSISSAKITVASTTSNLTTSDQSFTVTGNVSITTSATINKYTLTVDKAGNTGTITVTRSSSPNAGAATGTITSGAAIYYGDVLSIQLSDISGVCCYFAIDSTGATQSLSTAGPHSKTVSSDVTVIAVCTTYTSTSPWTFSGAQVTGYSGTPPASLSIPSAYYAITNALGSSVTALSYGSTAADSYATKTNVTEVKANSFSSKTSITSLTLPSTIKTIGLNAFMDCSNLTSITVNGTLSSVGAGAFCRAGLNTSAVTQIVKSTSCTLGQYSLAFKNGWFLQDCTQAMANCLLKSNYSSSYPVYASYLTHRTLYKEGGDNGTSNTTWWFYAHAGAYSNGSTLYEHGSRAYSQSSTAYVDYYDYHYMCWCNPGVNSSYPYALWYEVQMNGATNIASFRTPKATAGNCYSMTAGSITSWDATVYYTTTCLTDHTLITLANGKRKRADQITYKDLLLCYNFETGKQEYQYPLAITKGETHYTFTRIHLENNIYIDICGHHDIYDPKAHLFRTYGDGHILSAVLKDYYILDDSGQTVKIKSIERIEKEVTAYCIITSGTITAYADTVMVGMSHMNFGRIDSTNKFSKEFETDKLICYDYNTFKKEVYDEEEQDLIIGTCLHFAHYYNKDGSGLGRLLNPLKQRVPLPQYRNKNLYTLGFIDKELKEIELVQDEIIVLPEIKSKGKTKWYIVGEYKYLNPGDTYITKFSTVIRAV